MRIIALLFLALASAAVNRLPSSCGPLRNCDFVFTRYALQMPAKRPRCAFVFHGAAEVGAIDFTVKGEAIQDLFGVGRFPGGTSLVAGPVVFQVRSEDAERARTVLHGLQ